MLCIIRRQFERPEVALHRLLAIRLVLLRSESGLVGGDLAQVLRTGTDSGCYGGEALTLCQFVGTGRGGASVALGKTMLQKRCHVNRHHQRLTVFV